MLNRRTAVKLGAAGLAGLIPIELITRARAAAAESVPPDVLTGSLLVAEQNGTGEKVPWRLRAAVVMADGLYKSGQNAFLRPPC